MSTTIIRRIRALSVRALSGAAVLAAMLALTASPALAHDELLSSNPESGAVLAESPQTLALTFSGNLLEMGTEVILQDDADTPWPTADPVIDGTVVTVDVSEALPAGSYRLAWRVVSSDGHPIEGTVPFTVGQVSSAPPASATPSPTATAPSAAAPSATEASPAPSHGTEASPGRMILVGVAGAGVALLVYAGALWLMRRGKTRANRTDDQPGADDHTGEGKP